MFVVQFLRHSVLTVTFINNRMVMMLSIGPVALRIGMWLSFSSWREQIPMLWIRWLYCEITLIIYIYLAILIIDYVFYIVIIVIHVIHLTWMAKYLTLSILINTLVTYHFYLYQIWIRIVILLVITSLNIIKMICWSECREHW